MTRVALQYEHLGVCFANRLATMWPWSEVMASVFACFDTWSSHAEQRLLEASQVCPVDKRCCDEAWLTMLHNVPAVHSGDGHDVPPARPSQHSQAAGGLQSSG